MGGLLLRCAPRRRGSRPGRCPAHPRRARQPGAQLGSQGARPLRAGPRTRRRPRGSAPRRRRRPEGGAPPRGARGWSASVPRAERGPRRRGEPDLHERHDRHAQGRDAHAPELHEPRGPAGRRLPARARRRPALGPSAAPHLRVRLRASRPPVAWRRDRVPRRAHRRPHRRRARGRPCHGHDWRPGPLVSPSPQDHPGDLGPAGRRARGLRGAPPRERLYAQAPVLEPREAALLAGPPEAGRPPADPRLGRLGALTRGAERLSRDGDSTSTRATASPRRPRSCR